MVEEPIHRSRGQGPGNDGVEAGGVQVGGDCYQAALVGGVHHPVEGLGGRSRAGAGLLSVRSSGPRECSSPPRTPSTLATQLVAVLSDPDQMRHLGMECRRRFLENFTLPRVAERVSELYRRVGLAS